LLVLISYDIEKDRTRTRLAKKLLDFGKRVQYSVFEADINNDELKALIKLLKKVKLNGNDSIRLYRLCADCIGKIEIWGTGEVVKDCEYYIA
jgi:CRISPR-associated protein Cas2